MSNELFDKLRSIIESKELKNHKYYRKLIKNVRLINGKVFYDVVIQKDFYNNSVERMTKELTINVESLL